MNAFQHILIFGVRLYRWVISPAIVLLCGPLARCRFTPSCSQYALEALRTHGALRGSGLALRRICRCHPWGGCGDDPIPARRQVTAGIMPAEEGGILPPGAVRGGARRTAIPPGRMPGSTARKMPAATA